MIQLFKKAPYAKSHPRILVSNSPNLLTTVTFYEAPCISNNTQSLFCSVIAHLWRYEARSQLLTTCKGQSHFTEWSFTQFKGL